MSHDTDVPAGHDETVVDLESYLPSLLNRLSARMNEKLAEELRTIDLPLAHWRILAILKWRGPCTLSQVREWTVIDLSTASRAVKRLEADGRVSRAWNAKDTRARQISITPSGEVLFQKAWTIVDGFHRHAFSDLSTDEHDLVLAAMDKVLTRLSRSYWSD